MNRDRLLCVLRTKVTAAQKFALNRLADQRQLKPADILRDAVRLYLEHNPVPADNDTEPNLSETAPNCPQLSQNDLNGSNRSPDDTPCPKMTANNTNDAEVSPSEPFRFDAARFDHLGHQDQLLSNNESAH